LKGTREAALNKISTKVACGEQGRDKRTAHRSQDESRLSYSNYSTKGKTGVVVGNKKWILNLTGSVKRAWKIGGFVLGGRGGGRGNWGGGRNGIKGQQATKNEGNSSLTEKGKEGRRDEG